MQELWFRSIKRDTLAPSYVQTKTNSLNLSSLKWAPIYRRLYLLWIVHNRRPIFIFISDKGWALTNIKVAALILNFTSSRQDIKFLWHQNWVILPTALLSLWPQVVATKNKQRSSKVAFLSLWGEYKSWMIFMSNHSEKIFERRHFHTGWVRTGLHWSPWVGMPALSKSRMIFPVQDWRKTSW